MVRNLTGFAVFAFLVVMAWKLLTGLFGALIGLALTLLWWAFIGWVIYTILKLFAPDTARKVRETIKGEGAS
ncbi:MAG: hypothetical protein SFU57_07850 [Gemmatimonadales bacterium]|jgi:predicted lipid-binding transport protein (Tim44 family)|nr:hypothetical protein [Gemmatimonadales bacterium]MDZ4257963.1 hypothetical protein [Gemmatimonadales bacterium]MDZ4390364.1 hypothetical protein [Gemmatimonadales bacterium]PKL90832.1 MAG: hypothetical protein CVV20_06065 [Gemmatimonadetes bacterium HGW-Gemmatimonadetes-1]